MVNLSGERLPLRDALLDPTRIRVLDLAGWNLLIQQARAAGLLARIHVLCQEHSLIDAVPAEALWHLKSADQVYQAHSRDVRTEIGHIASALKMAKVKPVLLKGAAYLAAGDRAAKGRLFSDVDLFVPKPKIDVAEQMLRWNGWRSKKIDEYDERYYREWMHEIPPMIHGARGMTLDVHHNLLPLTGRLRLNADLIEQEIVASELPGVWTLSPADRVLHSAAHLFMGGEFENAFRDLSDLDLLLREFSESVPRFWDVLFRRTERLGLGQILFFTQRYTAHFFHTPIPDEFTEQCERFVPRKRASVIMDQLFRRVLLPMHESCDDRFSPLARTLMYVRSHWLRMPPLLLARHLLHKSLSGWRKSLTDDEPAG